jgi:hypothetical protein
VRSSAKDPQAEIAAAPVAGDRQPEILIPVARHFRPGLVGKSCRSRRGSPGSSSILGAAPRADGHEDHDEDQGQHRGRPWFCISQVVLQENEPRSR